MIDKIQLRDFGTHRKLDIEFGPYVNSIIGTNFQGKSTILRAIKWVVLNRPSGDSFINWDANKASVRLITDKTKVTRSKGKSTNIYRLNGKEFRAFGNDVPKEIKRALNIAEINFQGQHDAPFWFCETAGEVSRQLNAIVNLEVIDETLANIASEIRKSKITIDVISERITELETTQKDLDYVDDLNENLTELESLEKRHSEIARERSVLYDIVESVVLHVNRRKNAVAAVSDSKSALYAGAKYQKITVQVENLSKLVESGEIYQKQIDEKPPPFGPLGKFRTNWLKTRQSFTILEGLLDQAEEATDKTKYTKKELRQCQKELKKEVGSNCPLCGVGKKCPQCGAAMKKS